MAIFQCVHTGCLYEWTEQETIDTMRKHNEYREVVPVVASVDKPVTKSKKAKE
jgi:oligoribonuclease NrnB/cAMP/cGMP phosphodiesterase (DHH superfamily)